MDFLDLLLKKRDGGKLSPEEIDWVVRSYVEGEIPDYQMSALLMTIYYNGMDDRETKWLTESMANSGGALDLSSVTGFKVDKHSTGGVGDSVSLILAPLVASLGMKIGKLSGRGLGHTGGTIDKLESIPGFRVDLSNAEFVSGVRENGLAIMEHTLDLVPADQKLYALRDVTGTVESLPLIISSIMSKKIACNPDGVVLDVKVGRGAFMKNLEDATALGRGCKEVGERSGLTVTALVTDMNQPLGNSVGNALEVEEAISLLRGNWEGDLAEVSLNLAAELYLQSGEADSLEEALEGARRKVASGEALEKFRSMVAQQGGDPRVVDDTSLLPGADNERVVDSPAGGYLEEVGALRIGRAAGLLGAGRKEKGDVIDPGVGIRIAGRIGDEVCEGDPLARLFYSDDSHLDRAVALVEDAFSVSGERPEEPELIKRRIM